MRISRHILRLTLFALLLCGIAPAAPHTSQQEAAIRAVLDQQVTSWNHGDIPDFMQGYKNADDTTFVGKTVEHGFASILARYQKKYASKDQMGTLTFSDLVVRPLDARYATATGHFHLARSASAGGNAEGVFSLVFEKTTVGWKIILDHTS